MVTMKKTYHCLKLVWIRDVLLFYKCITYLFKKLINLFLAALGLRCCVRAFSSWAGATLCCGSWAFHCSGFSCCGARALGTQPSVVVARGLSSCGSWALERRLSSCGARTWLLCGMWDLPGPGLEPMSLALAGGFLTTAPPGKSRISYLEYQALSLEIETVMIFI